MRLARQFVVTVALLAWGLAPARADLWPGRDVAQVVADDLVESLAAEQFDEARRAFSPALSSRLSSRQIEAAWRHALRTNGRLLSQGRAVTRSTRAGKTTAVIIPARFDRATVDLRVSFDTNTAVSGLLLARRAAATATATVPGPPYGDESAFDEVDVIVGTTELAVPGQSGDRRPPL